MVFVMIFVVLVQPAFAEVVTTQKTEGYTDYVYVAGSPDNYPVEYYDEDLKAYRGMIPDLLGEISERSGVNFVYINGDKKDKNLLGENLQADIVSSATDVVSYGKDYLELISYTQNGESIKYGLVFTTLCNDGKIESIKTAANKIPADQKNGIYLSYASQSAKTNYKWCVLALIISLLLAALIIFLIVRIKKIQKTNAAEKMTDSETGMGNLQFFKYHFRYTISDISRSLYHVAYIILDISYLRSYHGDSSFDEVLKYTASVLSEHTGDREISARITENGFVFAFQSNNDEDAKQG